MEASCSLSRSTAAPRYQPAPEEKSLSVLSRAAPVSSRAASPCFVRIERTRVPRTLGSERSAHSTATVVPVRFSHACATEGWSAKVCRIGFALTPQPNPATASQPRGTLNRPMRSGVSSRCSTSADRARQADGNCGLAVTCYPARFPIRYKAFEHIASARRRCCGNRTKSSSPPDKRAASDGKDSKTCTVVRSQARGSLQSGRRRGFVLVATPMMRI
jgi:hypothetical protein